MMFFNVLNFYTIFLKFSKPGWVGMDSKRKMFFPIVCLSRPILARNKARMMFLIFILFFWNLQNWVWLERNQNENFCFLILGLLCNVLARNKAGMLFFNFLKFYTIFFGIFLIGLGWNGLRTKFFVYSFLTFPILFWLEIMPE